MCEAGGQNRVHQGMTQAANASPQLGWHSCAPSPWSHAHPHTASHQGSPEPHSILKPVLTGQRYFKPRGVTPDRLRSVLWELAEGRGYFNLYTFYQNNLYQRSIPFTRQAVTPGNRHVSKEDSPGEVFSHLFLWTHELNRLFGGDKITQEAVEAEIDFPIQTAFQRRPLLSIFLHIYTESLLQ